MVSISLFSECNVSAVAVAVASAPSTSSADGGSWRRKIMAEKPVASISKTEICSQATCRSERGKYQYMPCM